MEGGSVTYNDVNEEYWRCTDVFDLVGMCFFCSNRIACHQQNFRQVAAQFISLQHQLVTLS